MQLDFRNLPIVNLPYDEVHLCKQMMLRLYENIPFLAELPNIDSNDCTIFNTIQNIPGIRYENKKLLIDSNTTSSFFKALQSLDIVFNTDDASILDEYYSDSPFFTMYTEMIKRIKPKYTIVKLLGPFSLADTIFNVNTSNIIKEKSYRKYIVEAIGTKALWYINKIKSISPNTKLILLFDEPLLYKFGTLKRTDNTIPKEVIVSLFTKLYQKIQKSGGLVGIQSFSKCNWQLVLESKVNLISIDAYNNPNCLNLVTEELRHFLARGGYINWAIVPTNTEKSIKALNIDFVNKIFTKAIEGLSAEGVSLDLLYKHCTISALGNLANIPVLFAEKALIITNHLSKKIPTSSRLQQ